MASRSPARSHEAATVVIHEFGHRPLHLFRVSNGPLCCKPARQFMGSRQKFVERLDTYSGRRFTLTNDRRHAGEQDSCCENKPDSNPNVSTYHMP